MVQVFETYISSYTCIIRFIYILHTCKYDVLGLIFSVSYLNVSFYKQQI